MIPSSSSGMNVMNDLSPDEMARYVRDHPEEFVELLSRRCFPPWVVTLGWYSVALCCLLAGFCAHWLVSAPPPSYYGPEVISVAYEQQEDERVMVATVRLPSPAHSAQLRWLMLDDLAQDRHPIRCSYAGDRIQIKPGQSKVLAGGVLVDTSLTETN